MDDMMFLDALPQRRDSLLSRGFQEIGLCRKGIELAHEIESRQGLAAVEKQQGGLAKGHDEQHILNTAK